MATKLTVSFAGIGDAMRSSEVRAALHQRAQTIAGRARGLYAAEGARAEVEVVEGTNAKGRPYARVTSTAVNPEFGTSRDERRRTLGRAAQGG